MKTNIKSDVRRRDNIIKEILTEQELLNERNRKIKMLKNIIGFKRKIYPSRKRRKRAEELIKEGMHTQVEIIDILTIEFPEYKKESHYVLVKESKRGCPNDFDKLVIENQVTKILSFQ